MGQMELFQTQPPKSDPLQDARNAVRDNLTTGGVICPCCGRKARAWRLSIHAGMVKWLIELYRETLRSGSTWIDVRTVNQASEMYGGDYAKLKFWELIEPQNSETCPDEKRSIGLWRITADGIAFLKGLHHVPRHIWTFDNQVIDSPELPDLVFVNDLHPFDWKKFMGDQK
jgi:hypothetical protein